MNFIQPKTSTFPAAHVNFPVKPILFYRDFSPGFFETCSRRRTGTAKPRSVAPPSRLRSSAPVDRRMKFGLERFQGQPRCRH